MHFVDSDKQTFQEPQEPPPKRKTINKRNVSNEKF